MDLHVRPAEPAELPALKQLLAAHALPTADFETSAIDWLVAFTDADAAAGTLAGMIGLELFDSVGLLRSLVATRPGAGIGSALLAAAEDVARGRGVDRFFLLTQTAESFFAARGYAPVERASAPLALLATSEFRSLCPASAACLSRALR